MYTIQSDQCPALWADINDKPPTDWPTQQCLYVSYRLTYTTNSNNNNFFCANILEVQAQWRDKSKGLSKLIIINQCMSRQRTDDDARIGNIKEIGF